MVNLASYYTFASARYFLRHDNERQILTCPANFVLPCHAAQVCAVIYSFSHVFIFLHRMNGLLNPFFSIWS